MTETISTDTEIRHLSDTDKRGLADMVNYSNNVLRLMLAIPKDIDDCDKEEYVRKYNEANFMSIHNADDLQRRRRSDFEILLDEWGTSGQKRPRIKHLITLLDKVQLYRASNYLREQIGEKPKLPNHSISLNLESIQLQTGLTSNMLPNLSALNLTPSESRETHFLYNLSNVPTQQFQYNVLHEMTNGFDQSNLIGKGGFGEVFLAENLIPGVEMTAVKRMIGKGGKDRVDKKFLEEVKCMAKIDHRNIIKLFGYSINTINNGTWQLFLVYEFARDGSLAKRFKDIEQGNIVYEFKQRIKHMLDVSQGLNYLHNEHELFHRDIKPANILLDLDVAKLCDFGLIKSAHSNTATVAIGTPGYIAPENSHAQNISQKSDIFALGVVMLQTFTGLPLRSEKYQEDYLLYFVRDCVKNTDRQREVLPDIPGFPLNLDNLRFQLIEYAMTCADHDKNLRPQIISICETLELALSQLN